MSVLTFSGDLKSGNGGRFIALMKCLCLTDEWLNFCVELLFILSLNLLLCRSLLKLFTTAEIMRWTEVCSTYETELRTGSGETVFSNKTEDGNKRWADLKIRTVEHVRAFSLSGLNYSVIKHSLRILYQCCIFLC
jgi:hypothetical protein